MRAGLAIPLSIAALASLGCIACGDANESTEDRGSSAASSALGRPIDERMVLEGVPEAVSAKAYAGVYGLPGPAEVSALGFESAESVRFRRSDSLTEEETGFRSVSVVLGVYGSAADLSRAIPALRDRSRAALVGGGTVSGLTDIPARPGGRTGWSWAMTIKTPEGDERRAEHAWGAGRCVVHVVVYGAPAAPGAPSGPNGLDAVGNRSGSFAIGLDRRVNDPADGLGIRCLPS